MKTTYKLEITKRFEDKGGVAEVKGFDPKFIFNYDWKAGRKKDGNFLFTLNEGKVYFIREPYNGRKYYVKVVNSNLVELSKDDVEEQLHKLNNTNKSEEHSPDVNKQGNKLTYDVEFILVHLQETVKIHQLNEKGKSISKGMAYTLSKVAESRKLTKEFLFIRDAIKEGKSEEEIRAELIGNINKTEGNESELSKFDNLL